ncbi:DUF5672 family protein [Vibrio sp. WJH972]
MKTKRLCVIIPIHKEKLDQNEISALKSYQQYFENIDLSFIAPRALDCSFYEENYPNYSIRRFNNYYFKSPKTYNKLMLNKIFYTQYTNYEYIIIAHTDAIIFNYKADLNEFLDMGYDYVGPPWYSQPISRKTSNWKYLIKRIVIHKPSVLESGGGGFSLRKVDSFVRLLSLENLFVKIFWHFNEDIYFAYRGNVGKNRISVAPTEVAEKFALEEGMNTKAEVLKPIALHAWTHYFTSLEKLEEARQRINRT